MHIMPAPDKAYVTARNAAHGGFHPTRKHRTGWFKVPPAAPLSPAVPLCTRVLYVCRDETPLLSNVHVVRFCGRACAGGCKRALKRERSTLFVHMLAQVPRVRRLLSALGCVRTSANPSLVIGEIARPMSCVPGYFEVINTHTVGSLTIPRASIKWV